jgi:proton-dependent oligopeptide transporter, POT family
MIRVARNDTLFGHPRGLTVLFLTQMWEQVSWFGMRSLLVYYLTQSLLFQPAKASLTYGAYAAATSLTPMLGGLACDRLLGRTRSVLLGGLIMAAGHFMMAARGYLLPALALIALGSGLFVPSLPSQVTALYAPGDPRRLGAYNIYYVGVNLGAFLAPLLCGSLGEAFGWQWGLAAAGCGMLLGLTIYVGGAKYLPREAVRQQGVDQHAAREVASGNVATLVRIALLVALFRGAYEQVGNTVALWTDVGVDRYIGAHFEIPRPWFQSLNPLTVFAGAPLLAGLWTRQARAGQAVSSIRKMSIGAGLVGGAYLLLALLAWRAGASASRVSWEALMAFFVLMTLGELFILPVGLSLFGRLAPPRYAATTMACWFLTGFAGNLLAGVLGTLWSVLTHATFFLAVACLALGAGALLLTLDRQTRRAESTLDSQISGSGARDLVDTPLYERT